MIWKRNRVSRVTFLRFVVQAVGFSSLYFLFSVYPSVPMLYVLMVWFVLTLFLGRFFCGWICPFAFIMDVESVMRRALKVRYRLLSDKLNMVLHKGRYVILAVFLFLPVVLWLLDPPMNSDVAVMMVKVFAGPFRPYSIIMEPLVPFIVPWVGQLVLGGFNFSYPYAGQIVTFITGSLGQVFVVAFVVVTFVGAFFVRRVWCRFCPAGASFSALNRFKLFRRLPLLHIEKDEQKCTKCGVCKRVCFVQVNDVYEQKGGRIGTSQCMLCTRCVEMCPYEDTLKVKLGSKTVFNSRNWLEPSCSDE